MADAELYIGLMSGTSADAIDAVLVDFSQPPLTLLAHHSSPLTPDTRAAIHKLAQPGDDEIDRMGALDQQLGRAFAQAAIELLSQTGIDPTRISAIGSHGQTLRHRPPDGTISSNAFTLQVADPNLIAHLTGITTVADFRRRDMAAGGQGAPLVPALHQTLFHTTEADRAIVNVGGVANLTWLPAHGTVLGFDTGPGNNLMDAWIQRSLGKAYDEGGQWAAQGQVHGALLSRLIEHPYFRLPPPKSTGPESFHLGWLDDRLEGMPGPIRAEDVQATLLMLTAQGIAASIDGLSAKNARREVYLCGGGAHNRRLQEALKALLPDCVVTDTSALGLSPDWVEGVAFAWLARQNLRGLSGNLPSVTGADSPQVLGAVYPGRPSAGVR